MIKYVPKYFERIVEFQLGKIIINNCVTATIINIK